MVGAVDQPVAVGADQGQVVQPRRGAGGQSVKRPCVVALDDTAPKRPKQPAGDAPNGRPSPGNRAESRSDHYWSPSLAAPIKLMLRSGADCRRTHQGRSGSLAECPAYHAQCGAVEMA